MDTNINDNINSVENACGVILNVEKYCRFAIKQKEDEKKSGKHDSALILAGSAIMVIATMISVIFTNNNEKRPYFAFLILGAIALIGFFGIVTVLSFVNGKKSDPFISCIEKTIGIKVIITAIIFIAGASFAGTGYSSVYEDMHFASFFIFGVITAAGVLFCTRIYINEKGTRKSRIKTNDIEFYRYICDKYGVLAAYCGMFPDKRLWNAVAAERVTTLMREGADASEAAQAYLSAKDSDELSKSERMQSKLIGELASRQSK